MKSQGLLSTDLKPLKQINNRIIMEKLEISYMLKLIDVIGGLDYFHLFYSTFCYSNANLLTQNKYYVYVFLCSKLTPH